MVVAKNLSSMLTHSLIDMEGMGSPMYKALDVAFQSESLFKLLEGSVDVETIREQYNSRFGSYL